MCRTTINSAAVATAIAIAAAACLSGCAKEYRHKKLGSDSPEARQIGEMIAALRSAKPVGLEVAIARQSAGGLSQLQARSLRDALVRIAAAESAQVVELSRFGEKVYRAVIEVRTAEASEQVCMLLVSTAEGLRWAGPN